MTLVEVHEAFAPECLALEKEVGMGPERTNLDVGAISPTHRLAALSVRITTHFSELRRRGGRYGGESACIGRGQGGAVVEAFPKP